MTIPDAATYLEVGMDAPEPPCGCGSLICDTCGDQRPDEVCGAEHRMDLTDRGY